MKYYLGYSVHFRPLPPPPPPQKKDGLRAFFKGLITVRPRIFITLRNSGKN